MKSKNKQLIAGRTLFLILLLVFQNLSFAQQSVTVNGKVLQKENNSALEFASVLVLGANNQQIASVATDTKGDFSLKVASGIYTLKVTLLGFKEVSMPEVSIQTDQTLPTIYLQAEDILLETVNIDEKSTVQYQLDKKVFNVGKELVSKGGSANDLLNNVPSVSVNANGAVNLRGNSAVRILINGKPSVLTANNGLEQIPAENIEKVEVITNPSARYDSEGTAGIINIVLRKNRKSGLSSSIQATTGIPNNHGLGYNLSYKHDKINLFSDVRYRNITFLNEEGALRTTFNNNTVSFLEHRVENERNARALNIYAGGDYYINDKNTLTLSYYYRNNVGRSTTDFEFDYLDTNRFPTQLLQARESYREPQIANQIELNYVKNFDDEKKKLTFNLQYDFWNDDENESILEQEVFPVVSFKSLKSRDIESSKDFLFQTDYTVPMGEKSKIEIGAKGEIRNINSEYNVIDNGISIDSLDNTLHYRERIFGVYFQYGGAFRKLQYLLGLRSESSFTGSDDVLGKFNIDKKYTDLFPTVHLTYGFNDAINLQLSYSRRIQRPRFWQLNPFGGIADRRNITVGNPDLNPMYTDSYELSTIVKWKSLTFNPAIYHQFSNNLFEDQFTTNSDGYLISQQINSGNESRIGAELNVTYNPLKWLTVSGEVNYFNFEQRGIFRVSDQAFTSRINTRIKHKSWSAQANGNYTGARNSGQSAIDAQYWLDLGIGKDLWGEKMTVTLRADNIFNSREYNGLVTGDDYTSKFYSKNIGPRVFATVTYRFNRKKSDRERQPD